MSAYPNFLLGNVDVDYGHLAVDVNIQMSYQMRISTLVRLCFVLGHEWIIINHFNFDLVFGCTSSYYIWCSISLIVGFIPKRKRGAFFIVICRCEKEDSLQEKSSKNTIILPPTTTSIIITTTKKQTNNMRPKSIIILAILVLSLCMTFISTTSSKLDMFDRRDSFTLNSEAYQFEDNNSTSNSTVTPEQIAEYQAAFWTSVIITVTVIAAVWVTSKIDYSQDTMLYASELNKE